MNKSTVLSIFAGLFSAFGSGSIPTDIDGVRQSNHRQHKQGQSPEEAKMMLKKAELKRQRKQKLKEGIQ